MDRAVLLVIVLMAALWWVGGRQAGAETASATLTGLWVAPPGFCRDAGLVAMQLMISKPRANGSRLWHLHAIREDGGTADHLALASVAGEAGAVPRWWAMSREGGWTRSPATLKWEAASLIPAAVEVAVNPGTGQLRLQTKNKVWAALEKDAGASLALK